MVLQIERAGPVAHGDRRGRGEAWGSVVLRSISTLFCFTLMIGSFTFWPSLIFGGREVDVVGLPRARRIGHVLVGRLQRIDRAAAVVRFFFAKRIEYLDFITSLNVDAAISARPGPALPA